MFFFFIYAHIKRLILDMSVVGFLNFVPANVKMIQNSDNRRIFLFFAKHTQNDFCFNKSWEKVIKLFSFATLMVTDIKYGY